MAYCKAKFIDSSSAAWCEQAHLFRVSLATEPRNMNRLASYHSSALRIGETEEVFSQIPAPPPRHSRKIPHKRARSRATQLCHAGFFASP